MYLRLYPARTASIHLLLGPTNTPPSKVMSSFSITWTQGSIVHTCLGMGSSLRHGQPISSHTPKKSNSLPQLGVEPGNPSSLHAGIGRRLILYTSSVAAASLCSAALWRSEDSVSQFFSGVRHSEHQKWEDLFINSWSACEVATYPRPCCPPSLLLLWICSELWNQELWVFQLHFFIYKFYFIITKVCVYMSSVWIQVWKSKSNFLHIFFYFGNCRVGHAHHHTNMEVRVQLWGMGSRFPSHKP